VTGLPTAVEQQHGRAVVRAVGVGRQDEPVAGESEGGVHAGQSAWRLVPDDIRVMVTWNRMLGGLRVLVMGGRMTAL
jgi:hypothetical protein